jgi:hypothetical protein
MREKDQSLPTTGTHGHSRLTLTLWRRISHHERRYGHRRHDFANLLARAELHRRAASTARSADTSPLNF